MGGRRNGCIHARLVEGEHLMELGVGKGAYIHVHRYRADGFGVRVIDRYHTSSGLLWKS